MTLASPRLTPINRLRAAWRAGGGFKSLGMLGQPRSGLWWHMPGNDIDTSAIGDGTSNSAVMASLLTLSRSYTEPRIGIATEVDGEDEWDFTGPVAKLLRRPNQHMVGGHVQAYSIVCRAVTGDAYLYKVRSAAGIPVELWPLYPAATEPLPTKAGEVHRLADGTAYAFEADAFIGGFRYTMDGKEVWLKPEDVIHLKDGLDGEDMRHGIAPLRTVLREVLGDEEAGNFATALLKNMGVPGVILYPLNDDGPSPAQAQNIKDQYKDTFGRDKRGDPLVLHGGAMGVKVVSFSPEQMDFKALRRVPEERISAAVGVPAILAHLGAGLDAATYNNLAGLREYFTEARLAPQWDLDGEQLTWQLGPDFALAENQRIGFDLSTVQALQDDEDALFKRVGTAVQQGWMTVADAKRAVGLPTTPADEVYLRNANVVEVPLGLAAGELEAEVEALLGQQ